MKITLNTIISCVAGASLLLCGCEPKEKPLRNIDQLITITLVSGDFYILPLEKTSNGYIVHVSKGKFKKVSGSPGEIARQIYGDRVKEARWTSK